MPQSKQINLAGKYFLIFLMIFYSCNNHVDSFKSKRVSFSNNYIPIKSTKANQYFTLGVNALAKNQFEKALKYFIESNKLETGNVMILNSIGNTECDIGNCEAGFSYFNEAISLDSLFLDSYISYGTSLGKAQQYPKAINTLKLGLSKSKSNQFEHYALCFNLAVYYYKSGNCAQARHFIDIAMSHGTTNKEFEDMTQKVNNYIRDNCP